MSLIKAYYVHCEGLALARRRGESKADRMVRAVNRCAGATKGNANVTARAARAEAKKTGWVRHTEEFPIINSAPDAGSTKIPFDLCPVCAGELVAPTAPLPVRTQGEADCVAGLAANRETEIPTS